jgi:hypothetical protein
MSDSESETVVALPAPKGKAKKPRTPAQISATQKALEALQAKRKENWEAKKKELKAKEVKAKEEKPKEEKPKEEKPKTEVVGNIVVSGGPIDHARGRAKPEEDIPEWAKALNEKVDKALKKKKKVVIEESESEEEVVVIKKKKKDDTPPPPPPAPVAPAPKPENPLRRMLYRN